MALSVVPLIVSKLFRIPYCLEVNGLVTADFLQLQTSCIKRKIYGFFQKFNTKTADTIIVPARRIKKILIETYKISVKKIFIIENGVNIEKFSPANKDESCTAIPVIECFFIFTLGFINFTAIYWDDIQISDDTYHFFISKMCASPMTFGATANVIIHAGAMPVFVDVDRKTMNIDVSLIEEKITRNTKAIIPVHFAGCPCDMDVIIEIANKHGLLVISDAAHSFEAEYKGVKTGNIGDMNAFSFYVTKKLAMREGGIVTTNKKEWAEKIQTYALHGLDKDAWQRYSSKTANQYRVVYPGFKYNLMDMQAALGIQQIKRLEKYLKTRESIWSIYDKAFANLPVTIPSSIDDSIKHARHLYSLLIDIDQLSFDRDEFRQRLYNKNIGTGINFIALHLHPYYVETFGYKRGDFPNAEYISDRTISLPFSAKLTEEDVNDVIVNVADIIESR